MITILLNNTALEIPLSSSLADVMSLRGFSAKTGIAAALNGQVIPKSKWPETSLASNDKILVITATQGG